MTVRGTLNRRDTARGVTGRGVAALASAGVVLAAAGCTTGPEAENERASGRTGTANGAPVAEDDTPDVTVGDNVRSRGVAVDTQVSVTAEDGTLQRVRVVGRTEEGRQRVAGDLAEDGAEWTASQRLEPGATYSIKTVAVDAEGLTLRDTRTFRTEDLTLDEQTYPSIAPLDGETVGVGMPVIIKFDIPVTDRAAIERHLSVEAEPAVRGTWHWYSDTEVHFRPRDFWEPGSEVTVHADINSVDAGNGVYGQLDRSISFDVGQSVVSKINVDEHRMRVFIDGDLARTIPISAGKKGFETRSGTKIIMAKHESKRMDAATIGIDEDDPEYYNLANVKYAMRVTESGEFLHAAPWSVGSQGDDNVSHGCVGMSTADARWLFERTTRGDVVKVTGTDETLEPGNGWTDWNVSFAEYKQGSALS